MLWSVPGRNSPPPAGVWSVFHGPGNASPNQASAHSLCLEMFQFQKAILTNSSGPLESK
jgi:hypothetical protein